MRLRPMFCIPIVAWVLVLGGCTTYYKVVDPASGRAYYTTDIDRKRETVMFKDAASGATVTLPSSEVSEVSSEEFKQNTGKK